MVSQSIRGVAISQMWMLWFQQVAGLKIAQHRCMHAILRTRQGRATTVARAISKLVGEIYADRDITPLDQLNAVFIRSPALHYILRCIKVALHRSPTLRSMCRHRLYICTPHGSWSGKWSEYRATRGMADKGTFSITACQCPCKHDVCPRCAPKGSEIARAALLPAGIMGWKEKAPSLGTILTSSEIWTWHGTVGGRPVRDRAPSAGATSRALSARSTASAQKALRTMRERLAIGHILPHGIGQRFTDWNVYFVSLIQHISRCLPIHTTQIEDFRRIGSKFLRHQPSMSWTIITDLRTTAGITGAPIDPGEASGVAFLLSTLRHAQQQTEETLQQTGIWEQLAPIVAAMERFDAHRPLCTATEERRIGGLVGRMRRDPIAALYKEQGTTKTGVAPILRDLLRRGGCPSCREGGGTPHASCRGCKGPRVLAIATNAIRARTTRRRVCQDRGEGFGNIRRQLDMPRDLKLHCVAQELNYEATQRRMRWLFASNQQTDGDAVISCCSCSTPRPGQGEDWRNREFYMPGGLYNTLTGRSPAFCRPCWLREHAVQGSSMWMHGICLTRHLDSLQERIREFLLAHHLDSQAEQWRGTRLRFHQRTQYHCQPCKGDPDYSRLEVLQKVCPLCLLAEDSHEHRKLWCPVTTIAVDLCQRPLGPTDSEQDEHQGRILYVRAVARMIAIRWSRAHLPKECELEVHWHRSICCVVQATIGKMPKSKVPAAIPCHLARWMRVDCDLETICYGHTLFAHQSANCETCRQQPHLAQAGLVGYRHTWLQQHPHPRRKEEVLQSSTLIHEGQTIVTVRSRTTVEDFAHEGAPPWPIVATVEGELPKPRWVNCTVETPTVRWKRSQCMQCQACLYSLVATTTLAQGRELTVPAEGIGDGHQQYRLRFYFDGGAEMANTPNAALGAGVSVWAVGPGFHCIRVLDLAIPVPHGQHCGDAEGYGAYAAIAARPLARSIARELPITLSGAEEVLGDNIATIEALQGSGRIRAKLMRRFMQPIESLRAIQGIFTAEHVPRALNTHADAQATAAIRAIRPRGRHRAAQRNNMSMRANAHDTQAGREHEGRSVHAQTTLSQHSFRQTGGESWLRGPPTHPVTPPQWWNAFPLRPPEVIPHRDKEVTQCFGTSGAEQRYAWLLEPHTLNQDIIRQIQAIMRGDVTGVIQSWMQHSVDIRCGQRGAFHLIQIDYATFAIRSCTGGVFHPRITRALRFQLAAASSYEIDVCPPAESIIWTALSCIVDDDADKKCMRNVYEAMHTWLNDMQGSMRSFHELVWAATWDRSALEIRARRLGMRMPERPDRDNGDHTAELQEAFDCMIARLRQAADLRHRCGPQAYSRMLEALTGNRTEAPDTHQTDQQGLTQEIRRRIAFATLRMAYEIQCLEPRAVHNVTEGILLISRKIPIHTVSVIRRRILGEVLLIVSDHDTPVWDGIAHDLDNAGLVAANDHQHRLLLEDRLAGRNLRTFTHQADPRLETVYADTRLQWRRKDGPRQVATSWQEVRRLVYY